MNTKANEATQNYEIVLFTSIGTRTEIYNTSQPLEEFQKLMIEKYKTFIMHTSKLIN